MPQYPLVNGVRRSWTSVEAKFAVAVIGGITEINYAPKLDPAKVRGAGPLIIGMTTGLADYSADCSMLLAEYSELQTMLGPAFFTAFFDIEVSYSDEGYTAAGLPVITDWMKVRISEVSAAMSNGSADALVRKLTLVPIDMRLNGVSPMPNQPSMATGALGVGVNITRRVLGI